MARKTETKNQLTEAVLGVFSRKGIRDISLSDIADECGTSALAVRLKYGSVEKVLEITARDCFETVFSSLNDSVRSGKSAEECWSVFRDQVVESHCMVLFYEAYREAYGKGFEDLSECEECARMLFPAASDLHFLWSHFIFDAKRSASKILKAMRSTGASRQEASSSVNVPNLCSTSMRAHIISFEMLCA